MAECLIGSILVPDIANPRPEDVDVPFMKHRLATIVRFTGHLAALTVAEHQRLCGEIARELGLSEAAIEWAEHHDDHEYATGDWARPLQHAAEAVDGLALVQKRWDVAIRGALGLAEPSDEVLRDVALVDVVALAMEWRHCLGRPIRELRVSEQVARLSVGDHLIGHVLTGARKAEIAEGRRALAA